MKIEQALASAGLDLAGYSGQFDTNNYHHKRIAQNAENLIKLQNRLVEIRQMLQEGNSKDALERLDVDLDATAQQMIIIENKDGSRAVQFALDHIPQVGEEVLLSTSDMGAPQGINLYLNGLYRLTTVRKPHQDDHLGFDWIVQVDLVRPLNPGERALPIAFLM